jgi:hypothetical protein
VYDGAVLFAGEPANHSGAHAAHALDLGLHGGRGGGGGGVAPRISEVEPVVVRVVEVVIGAAVWAAKAKVVEVVDVFVFFGGRRLIHSKGARTAAASTPLADFLSPMASLHLGPTWGWRTSSSPHALVRLSAVQPPQFALATAATADATAAAAATATGTAAAASAAAGHETCLTTVAT